MPDFLAEIVAGVILIVPISAAFRAVGGGGLGGFAIVALLLSAVAFISGRWALGLGGLLGLVATAVTNRLLEQRRKK